MPPSSRAARISSSNATVFPPAAMQRDAAHCVLASRSRRPHRPLVVSERTAISRHLAQDCTHRKTRTGSPRRVVLRHCANTPPPTAPSYLRRANSGGKGHYKNFPSAPRARARALAATPSVQRSFSLLYASRDPFSHFGSRSGPRFKINYYPSI